MATSVTQQQNISISTLPHIHISFARNRPVLVRFYSSTSNFINPPSPSLKRSDCSSFPTVLQYIPYAIVISTCASLNGARLKYIGGCSEASLVLRKHTSKQYVETVDFCTLVPVDFLGLNLSVK